MNRRCHRQRSHHRDATARRVTRDDLLRHEAKHLCIRLQEALRKDLAWQIIDGSDSANAFADRIAARPFRSFRGTSISGALAFGTGLFEKAAFAGARRVIDISGDGPNNIGPPVTATRDAALAKGIVINGLPILISPSPTFSHLDSYYEQCVTGGPGSFVLPIYAASEFSTAIRRKLILEVSGIANATTVRIDAAAPIDCLQGERDRRFFSDPYFPELDR